jgi:hypothetical protein
MRNSGQQGVLSNFQNLSVAVALEMVFLLIFRTRPISLDSVKSADAENQLVDTQPDIDDATLVEFFAQPLESLLLLP